MRKNVEIYLPIFWAHTRIVTPLRSYTSTELHSEVQIDKLQQNLLAENNFAMIIIQYYITICILHSEKNV